MTALNTTMNLPNPLTPMAFFKPTTAIKITNQNYAAVGSLAVSLNFSDIRMRIDSECFMQRQVLLWDILLHIPQDYKLATRYRINISFVIYCISR